MIGGHKEKGIPLTISGSEFEALYTKLSEHSDGIRFPAKSIINMGVLWGGASAQAALQVTGYEVPFEQRLSALLIRTN